MKIYVLDTCALVAFIYDELGGDIVENLPADAASGSCETLQ